MPEYLNKMWCLLAAVLMLAPPSAEAQPVALRLNFFTSDRSVIYECQIKPLVDAINSDRSGLVTIEVQFSGGVSPDLGAQAQLVLDGKADLAVAVPGYSPQRFPDTDVIGLPGLFSNEIEAARVYFRLANSGALAGYQDFLALAAFLSVNEDLHSRKPITTLSELKGQTIRVNNDAQAMALRQLGANPTRLPINQATDALSRGVIDGAVIAPNVLYDFGFGRMSTYHYLLPVGGVPTMLVMNRKKLESLPPAVQEVIRRHSGEALSVETAVCFGRKNDEVIARLKADPRHTVTDPSAADRAASAKAFGAVADEWASHSAHNRTLLARVREEIARVRIGQ